MKCQNEGCDNEAKVKFCGKSCAAKTNNRLHPKRVSAPDSVCIRCKTSYKRGRNATGKYCSMICSQNHRREVYISEWLLGNNNGSTKDGELDARIRKYLITQSSNRCSSPTCYVPGGWSISNPSIGKVILTIDHIDGNWQNNSVDNLIVLCYNCHTLTPTFGSLNKGKGVALRNVGSRRH